mmetsp:Transcript_81454/g.170343  ORF Transcript_81454/g.170343 Transcript_81454/m.170343 type:complete len:288 (-) Transcript_81454:315-1178(-)
MPSFCQLPHHWQGGVDVAGASNVHKNNLSRTIIRSGGSLVLGLHAPSPTAGQEGVDDQLGGMRHDARDNHQAHLLMKVSGQGRQNRDAARKRLLAGHERDRNPLGILEAEESRDSAIECPEEEVHACCENRTSHQVQRFGSDNLVLRPRNHEPNHDENACVLGHSHLLLVLLDELVHRGDELSEQDAEGKWGQGQPAQLSQQVRGRHREGSTKDLRRRPWHRQNPQQIAAGRDQNRQGHVALCLCHNRHTRRESRGDQAEYCHPLKQGQVHHIAADGDDRPGQQGCD